MAKELKMYAWGNKHFPKHCFKCGRAFILKEYHAGFDSKDGKAIYHTLMYCPAFSASIFPKLSHLSYRFDEDGDEIIERYP